MAKKQKEKAVREWIAVFYKRHTDVIKSSPQVNCNYMKTYQAGEIVWDESEIERFIQAGAPIGVYYRDVDGTAES